MDQQRFDAIARRFAGSSSRRMLLRLVGAGVVAGFANAWTRRAETAEAAPSPCGPITTAKCLALARERLVRATLACPSFNRAKRRACLQLAFTTFEASVRSCQTNPQISCPPRERHASTESAARRGRRTPAPHSAAPRERSA